MSIEVNLPHRIINALHLIENVIEGILRLHALDVLVRHFCESFFGGDRELAPVAHVSIITWNGSMSSPRIDLTCSWRLNMPFSFYILLYVDRPPQ
jgi:hypothetical protein